VLVSLCSSLGCQIPEARKASECQFAGVTVAGGDEFLRGILVYSRRDGQETENNSGTVDACQLRSAES
jgi:hypothetical protein